MFFAPCERGTTVIAGAFASLNSPDQNMDRSHLKSPPCGENGHAIRKGMVARTIFVSRGLLPKNWNVSSM